MPSLEQVVEFFNKLLANFQQHHHTGTDSLRVNYNDLINKPTSSSSSYGGSIVSNVASTPFPTGWSVAHASGGIYTITHTLGSTPYAVTVSVTDNSTITICDVHNKGTSTFAISCFNQTASITWSGTDTDIDFIVST